MIEKSRFTMVKKTKAVSVSLAYLVRNNTYYRQGRGFEPQTTHLSTFKVNFSSR